MEVRFVSGSLVRGQSACHKLLARIFHGTRHNFLSVTAYLLPARRRRASRAAASDPSLFLDRGSPDRSASCVHIPAGLAPSTAGFFSRCDATMTSPPAWLSQLPRIACSIAWRTDLRGHDSAVADDQVVGRGNRSFRAPRTLLLSWAGALPASASVRLPSCRLLRLWYIRRR